MSSKEQRIWQLGSLSICFCSRPLWWIVQGVLAHTYLFLHHAVSFCTLISLLHCVFIDLQWGAFPFMHIHNCIHICILIQRSFPCTSMYVGLSLFIHTAVQNLSAMHTHADRSLHSNFTPTVSECRCVHITFFAIVHALGSWLMVGCVHSMKHMAAVKTARNEKFEHFIELVWEATSLYHPASPDHMDAIRNANTWASISMVPSGHPK